MGDRDLEKFSCAWRRKEKQGSIRCLDWAGTLRASGSYDLSVHALPHQSAPDFASCEPPSELYEQDLVGTGPVLMRSGSILVAQVQGPGYCRKKVCAWW